MTMSFVERLMKPFEFHGDLFELRQVVIQALGEAGFVWLADYGAVDLQHDVYGLEVTAIHDENDAKAIEKLLKELLPNWRYSRRFYEDLNVREMGWKVIISRWPEDFEGLASIRRWTINFLDGSPWYLKVGAAGAWGLIIAVCSLLAGLNGFSDVEIVITLLLVPTLFAFAATILVMIDKIRHRSRN